MIAKTAAVALTLAAHASSAYAGSIVANPSKSATVNSVVPKLTTGVPTLTSVVPKVNPVVPTLAPVVPTVTPVVTKGAPNTPAGTKNSTGFGSGVWVSTSATPQNPVTGLWASTVSRLTFGANGKFTEDIIVQGGTGIGAGKSGAGGLVEITGQYKQLSATSVQFTETAESICTGLGCMSYPTSSIGKPFTAQVTANSPGVVTGAGGATWTEIQQ
jgi:hypothetical protein